MQAVAVVPPATKHIQLPPDRREPVPLSGRGPSGAGPAGGVGAGAGGQQAPDEVGGVEPEEVSEQPWRCRPSGPTAVALFRGRT